MEIRALNADEVCILEKHLPELADYHNRVASSFSGVYPIVPPAEALRDTAKSIQEGSAHAEALFDDEGAVAGYCVVHRHAETGDIDWLNVREDVRGEGWGRVLLERGLKYLRGNGVQLVDALVVRGNPAKEFYRELGFKTRMEVMSKRL